MLNPSIMAVSLLSIAVAGYLVGGPLHTLHATALRMTFGPVDTIFLAAGLLCVLGGVNALLNLRGVDRRLARADTEPASAEAEAPASAAAAVDGRAAELVVATAQS
jgi:hypothetical protein